MTTFDLPAGETVRLWWIGRQLVTSTTDNKLSEIKGQSQQSYRITIAA